MTGKELIALIMKIGENKEIKIYNEEYGEYNPVEDVQEFDYYDRINGELKSRKCIGIE